MDANTVANLKKHDFVFLAELGKGGFGCESTNSVTVEINGHEHHSNKPIISIGREGYSNTFTIPDELVSRRHLIIVNLKNDVWLYDMSTSGTYVNGERVKNKSFLLGRCEIKVGPQTFFVKSDRGLLL